MAEFPCFLVAARSCREQAVLRRSRRRDKGRGAGGGWAAYLAHALEGVCLVVVAGHQPSTVPTRPLACAQKACMNEEQMTATSEKRDEVTPLPVSTRNNERATEGSERTRKKAERRQRRTGRANA